MSRLVNFATATCVIVAFLLTPVAGVIGQSHIGSDQSDVSGSDSTSDEPNKPVEHRATSVVGEFFFVAPVTTDLQRRLLGAYTTEGELRPASDLAAYATVNAYQLFTRLEPQLSDPTGEIFVPVRSAIQRLVPDNGEGELRLILDYGHMNIPKNARQMVTDTLRGMAHESGYSDVEVRGTWTNPVNNQARDDWKSLSPSTTDRTDDETCTTVGNLSVYRVTTPLSRYLTDDVDCFIETRQPLSVSATRIFPDEDIEKISAAIEALKLEHTDTVLLTVRLRRPSESYDIASLPLANKSSDFHFETVRLLRDAGFKKIRLHLETGNGRFVFTY